MNTVARLCAGLLVFGAACAPKGEIPVTDSAATAAAPTVDAAAVRQAIDQVNAKLVDALQRGDTAVLMAAFDNDAMVMQQGTPAWQGRSGIATNGTAMLQAVKFSDMQFTTGTVDVAGDYAIETGTYRMTLTPKGGKPVPDTGKYVTVWKKQADGSWKVYRDISNTDIPPKG